MTDTEKMREPSGAVDALLDYSQMDEDGIMVCTSRQAIHEVVGYLRFLQAALSTTAETHTLAMEEALWALEECREIYAGMEGFISETAPEAYCQQTIKKMYDCNRQAIASLTKALGR